jgi:ferric-dicitrate binding protein FerR (iron transport regulator)
MTCDTIQSRLSAWHDGELPAEERQAIETHLATCSPCRAAADDLIALDARLRRVFKHDRAAAQELAASVVSQLNAPPIIRRISPWRTGIVALTAAAAGFLLAWFLFARPPLPQHRPNQSPELVQRDPEPTIRLTIATGAVEVEKDGQWKSMPTGGLIACGSKVRTPANTRCEFRTPDGSEVRLNHDSEVVFDTERKVRVEKGQVWSTVVAAKDQFKVCTPNHTVTALGTQFDVDYQTDNTVLTVYEGKTQVEGGGQSRTVNAGQQLRLVPKESPQIYTCPSEELFQATGWVHEILVLKGRDNPELVKRINAIFAGIGHAKMDFLAEEEIRALGDHCVVPLTKFIQSDGSKERPERRQRAARLIAELAQPRSIGEMIQLLTDSDPHVRSTIATGLKRLTGKELAFSPPIAWQRADAAGCQAGQKTWQDWWSENQKRYPITQK